MSSPAISPLLPALALMLTVLSVVPADATYYYYYYYQPQRQSAYTCNAYSYNFGTTCHVDTCYTPQTWDQCCLEYFNYNGYIYKQCRCTFGTTCAHSPLIATPPQTTAAAVPTTVAATTTKATTVAPTTTAASTTAAPTTTVAQTTTAASTTAAPTTTVAQTTTTASTTAAPTTTVAQTTPTTAGATTTVPFKSLCSSSFRLLNGNAVNDQCDFSGVANITRDDGTRLSCHAVYAPATVNGTKKLTFVTSDFCMKLINGSKGSPFDIQIGDQTVPIIPNFFSFVQGTNGVSFLEINPRYGNALKSLGCQKPACPYDNTEKMAGKLDYNQCKLVSWGSTNANTFRDYKLMEAEIQLSPLGCPQASDPDVPANALCFRTVNNKNLLCAGDAGSATYCKAPSNGEWILLGIAAKGDCDRSPYVRVILIP